MATGDPFETARVADLIRFTVVGADISVSTHEGGTKEFKESFTWGSIGLYARTMAGYSNARGGYIFFGVTDNPRRLVGLESKALDQFENLDQAKLTESLNDLFSPELHWVATVNDFDGKSVGIIYTFESQDKPVVAKKSYQSQNANVVEGDIIYRYNSRTERMKYPELRRVLEDAKVGEQRRMMRHVEELIRAGASNAAVLDFNSSTLLGPSGQRVLVDEELLKKISFIREGEFNEVTGAPTLKIVGEVQPATTIALGPARIIKGSLSPEDVLEDFLSQRQVTGADQYVRIVASGNTSFLPVQFYRGLQGWSHDDLISYVDTINTRSAAKKKLLERLRASDEMRLPSPTTSTQHASTVERRSFWEDLIAGKVDAAAVTGVRKAQYFAEATKSLTDDQIVAIFDPLMVVLMDIFTKYYDTDAKVADGLRRAACRIDVAMFSA